MLTPHERFKKLVLRNYPEKDIVFKEDFFSTGRFASPHAFRFLLKVGDGLYTESSRIHIAFSIYDALAIHSGGEIKDSFLMLVGGCYHYPLNERNHNVQSALLSQRHYHSIHATLSDVI